VTRIYHPFLSPGWCLAYALGALAWCLLWRWFGAAFVVGVWAFGGLALHLVGNALGTGHIEGEDH